MFTALPRNTSRANTTRTACSSRKNRHNPNQKCSDLAGFPHNSCDILTQLHIWQVAVRKMPEFAHYEIQAKNPCKDRIGWIDMIFPKVTVA
ncbi:hypothetical protein, partial [Novipirellula maiorica]|uniref:hypothetical protein n=1 Tax=Novipirellula maiorica TaxID=1265734 RepID=UPI001F34052B